MNHIVHVALLVRDYDEALAFYVGKLGFTLVEDTYIPEQDKRWVVVAPPHAPYGGATLLLARAASEEQVLVIGEQGGGRVFLFLATDDFQRDFAAFFAISPMPRARATRPSASRTKSASPDSSAAAI